MYDYISDTHPLSDNESRKIFLY